MFVFETPRVSSRDPTQSLGEGTRPVYSQNLYGKDHRGPDGRVRGVGPDVGSVLLRHERHQLGVLGRHTIDRIEDLIFVLEETQLAHRSDH